MTPEKPLKTPPTTHQKSFNKPTLHDFFSSIGHTKIESTLKKILQQILNSFANTYSKILRLIYLYSAESIVGQQFLKEIEVEGYLFELIELLQIWAKRTEDLNQNLSESFINYFYEIPTKNAPIIHSFSSLSEEKYNFVNDSCKCLDSTTTEAILQDCIAIMSDDLEQNRSRPYYWDMILDFDKKFQDIRLNSDRFFNCHNKLGILEYEGEFDPNSENKSILNGYGAVYKQGLTSKQGTFVNGKLEGENCAEYSKLGHIASWGTYKSGLRNGYAIELDNDSDIIQKGTYVNGLLEGEDCEEYHQFGNIKYKGAMKNGLYNGQGTQYYNNAMLKYSGNFENGYIQGENCIIYQKYTGNVKYIGQISKGTYNGHGSVYEKDKKDPIMKGLFQNGTLITGMITIFYKNGNKEFTGGIDQGKYQGHGKLHHTNGKIVYEGHFVDGKESGSEVVIYDDSGNISLLCGMENGEAFGYIEAFDKDKQMCYYHGEFDEKARMNVLKDGFMDAYDINYSQKGICSSGKNNCEIF